MKLLYPLAAVLIFLLVLPEHSLWSQEGPEPAQADVGRDGEPQQAQEDDPFDLPHDLPTSLDAAISRALQNNPDIRLAELRIEQAHAELRQQRLKVTQEVTSAFRRFQHSRDLFKRQQQLAEVGRLDLADLGPAMISLAESEALMRYHLGFAEAVDENEARGARGGGRRTLSQRERPDLPDDIRKRLEDARVPAKVDISLEDFENMLSEETGITFLFDNDLHHEIAWTFTEAPNVLTLMTILHDKDGFCFLVRDYGIFVTYELRARGMLAPAIPADLPYAPGAPAYGAGMGMGGMGGMGFGGGGMF